MEVPTIDQFNQICRLCLSCSELVTIFDRNPRTMQETLSMLVRQTVEMLGLTIDPDDYFPKKICTICKDFLRKLYKFRNICHEANDLLVEAFSISAEPVKHEEPQQPEKHISQIFESIDHTQRSPKILWLKSECPQQAKSANVQGVESTAIHETTQEADSSSSLQELANVKAEENLSQSATVNDAASSAEEYEYLEAEVVEVEEIEGEILQEDLSEATFQEEEEHYVTEEQHIELIVDEEIDQSDFEIESSNSKKGKICKVCGKHSTCMKYHMMCHTGERPFECNFCDKRFRTTTKLNTHVNGVHLKIRKYVCEICDKKFLDAGNLRNHKVTHGGERRFICDYEDCGKSFALPGTLAVHKKSHTQDKQFSCEFCSKLFLYKWLLVKHLRIHTGERPYECDICNKKFTTITHMHSHKKVHDPNRQKSTKKRKSKVKKSSKIQQQDSDTS